MANVEHRIARRRQDVADFGPALVDNVDFGDNWRHTIALEKILPISPTTVRPICLAGERHCPPEDVGGALGYEEFLQVVFEPTHEEYEHSVRWGKGPSPVNLSVGRFSQLAVSKTPSGSCSPDK
ncbi:MAG: plasmid pRiA4b ORF-3 family protein [Acidobacteria bacterium]|nr:plasmid pRiA4b ORF-3 family protein [Acidobacteriota bacterium]